MAAKATIVHKDGRIYAVYDLTDDQDLLWRYHRENVSVHDVMDCSVKYSTIEIFVVDDNDDFFNVLREEVERRRLNE